MSWVRVDDHLTEHPKALALGKDRLAALGLWLHGNCYAGRYLTDGHVPASALPRGSARLARRLVEVGMWEETPVGYLIHDYHAYQPSREAVLHKRQVRALAGKAGGQKSGESRREANGEANASGDASTMLNPGPARTRPDKVSNPPTPLTRERAEREHVARKRETGGKHAMTSLSAILRAAAQGKRTEDLA